MTLPIQHISVSISASPTLIYGYAAKPENLPNWASGLSEGIKKVGDQWVSNSPMGVVKIQFAENNRFGVLDHEVTLPSGEKVLNPMRVIANAEGSEIIFSVTKRQEMSDSEFEDDCKTIKKDLLKLKSLIES